MASTTAGLNENMESARAPELSQSRRMGQSILNEYHEFAAIKIIGNGGFGRVFSVRKRNGKDKNEVYAMKEIATDPELAADDAERKHEEILNERKILELVRGFDFCVQMMYAFKIDHKYYLVLEYFPRGDLCEYLNDHGPLEYNQVRLCAAEIILALEFLHGRGIVYHDLKPENILVDECGHLVLTDFGLAVQLVDGASRHERGGTIQYMAPEALRVTDNGFQYAVDFWALGCLLYEILTGNVPFNVDDELNDDVHATQFLQFLILYEDPCYDHQHFRSHPIAQRFLEELLAKKPNQRLGGQIGDVDAIKGHAFFGDINWKYVYSKKYQVLGEMDNNRRDYEPPVFGVQKLYAHHFFRNGYDYVTTDMMNSVTPETMTTKLERILGPREHAFDALYDVEREPKVQLYNSEFDCHMLLPKSKAIAFVKQMVVKIPANNDDD